MADARGLARLLPARAAARGRPGGRHPHRGGAPAPVRRDDPRAGAPDADDPRWPGRTTKAPVAVRRRAARRARGRSCSRIDRTGDRRRRRWRDGRRRRRGEPARSLTARSMRRVMPLPSARERRLALRLRATELVGLLEATDGRRSRGRRRRAWRLEAQLAAVGRSAAMGADEARAAGLDPLTFREIGSDTGAGANLLAGRAAARAVQLLAVRPVRSCPLRYAFSYVYRMPPPERPVGALTFGSTAHAAFEAFTKERRERLARGEPPPTREDLERLFRAQLDADRLRRPDDGGGLPAARRHAARQLLGRASSAASARRSHEELDFELVLDAGDGRPTGGHHGGPSTGSTGCRPAASRSSTTRPARSARRRTSTRASSSPSTRWPAATRWAWARPSG